MTYLLQTHASSRESRAGKSARVLLLMGTLVLAMAVSPADAGKIYKWVDEQGHVHYGSEKPAEATAENMRVNTDKTGTVPGQAALAAEQKKIDDDAKAIKEKGIPAQPPVPALPRKEVMRRCQQARDDLARIGARGQMRIRDEKGNITYATDEAKQQRIAAAKKAVSEYCH